MKKTVFTALIAAFAAIAMPGESRAAYTITVSDGISAPVVVLGGANGVAGVHTFIYANGVGDTGELTLSFLSFGGAAPGNGSVVGLSTNSISITTDGTLAAKTLTISVETNGYNMQDNYGTVRTSFTASALIGTAIGSSTVAGSTVAGSNINLANATPGPIELGGVSFATANFGANPVTFGNKMILNLDASTEGPNQLAAVTLTSQFVAAPAPPALLLAAFGIPAMGLVRRWTRKVKSTEDMAVAA